MTGRYTLEFSAGDMHRTKGSGSTHTIDVYLAETCAFQMGVNIAHKRQERVYFKDLETDTKDLLTEKQRMQVLAALPEMVLGDPSLSTFSFASPSIFYIHVADQGFQRLLNAEAKRLQRSDLMHIVEKEGYQATEAMLHRISQDPTLYPLVLSILGLEKRERYHASLQAERVVMQHRYEKNTQARKILREMQTLEQRLAAQMGHTGIKKPLKDLEKKLGKVFLPLEEAELEEGYTSYDEASIDTQAPFFAHLLSAIRCMPTTLHKRANAAYSENIRTYQLTEARSLVEQRRRIIHRANHRARKAGREWKEPAREVANAPEEIKF